MTRIQDLGLTSDKEGDDTAVKTFLLWSLITNKREKNFKENKNKSKNKTSIINIIII